MAFSRSEVWNEYHPTHPKTGLDVCAKDSPSKIYLDARAFKTLTACVQSVCHHSIHYKLVKSRFNLRTCHGIDTCSGGYDEILQRVGPQSFLNRGLYVLRPALYLYIGQSDWADASPPEEMHLAKMALVESAHPAYAQELSLYALFAGSLACQRKSNYRGFRALAEGGGVRNVVPLSPYAMSHLLSIDAPKSIIVD